MASKYQLISALSERAAEDVTRSPVHWMGYLDTASRLYRYPFHEQLLIYAQRPDATACASLELWNNKMGRWVNRGAKGIALIDDSTDLPRLKYVFDVSDTHPLERSREVYLWQLQKEDTQMLMEHLQDTYGIDSVDNLSDCLYEVARATVSENMSDYMHKLSYAIDGSFLEDLDELNLEVRFRELMTNSLHYTLAKRCGLDTLEIFEPLDFQNIYEFSTPMALAQLGCAVSETAMPILMDIGQKVRTMEMDSEISQNRLAKDSNVVYNNFTTLMCESAEREQDDNTEKGDVSDDENGLHEQSELFDPEHSDGRAGQQLSWTLREDAEDVSEGASQRTVSGTADDRETVGAPSGDRQDSGRETGTVDGELHGSGERERSIESRRSDGLAAEDEQHSSESRGNRDERADLQLNTTPDSDKLSGILLNTDVSLPVVDEVIRMGSNQSRSVLRIAAHFMLDAGDDAEFLKKEYGYGAKGIVENGVKYAVWFDEKGMKFARGNHAELNPEAVHLSWEQIAERTKELIHSGQYAPQVILNQAISNERTELAQKLWYLHQDRNDEFFMDDELFRGGFPASTENLAVLLEDEQFLSDTLQGLGDFVMRYEEDRSILRFHFHKPDELLRRLSELENPPITLPQSSIEHFRDNVDFVTEDEIDHYFMGGGVYSDGRLSTYSYFIHDHTDKEKADFLKDQHGTGGGSHALCRADNSHSNHDAKGLSLTRGSFEDKEVPNIFLTWSKASERVENLILSGRYLTDKDYARIPGYERFIMAQRINSFYARQEDKSALALPDGTDMFHMVEAIEKQLENPAWLENVVSDMSSVIGDIHETDERYERMQSLYADVVSYKNGTFSLFMPSRSVYAEAQKRGTELYVPIREEAQTEKVPVYHYEVGDSAFIHGLELEIDGIYPETVMLRDKSFPLMSYSYDPQQFETLLRDNPLNDHMIVEWVERTVEIAKETETEITEPEVVEADEETQTETPKELSVLDAASESKYEQIREQYQVSVLVGFEHGGNIEFYGEDAKTVSELLGRKLLDKQLESGESIPVTGFPADQWVHYGKQIWSHGQNLVLMGEGENGTHQLINEYKAKDYIPVGTKLTIDDRQFQIDAVDYQSGKVSLRDLTFQNETGFPIFRSESTAYIRSFVEEQQWDNIESIEQEIKGEISTDAPDRYSIRLHPNEGGITGIWDAALDRFYEEGGQVLRFAEQDNAIEYLANIQRTKGMEPTEPIFTTPTGKVYHIGDSLTSKAVENQETLMVLERVDEDDVWYTLPSVPEQETVNIDRTAFERYLDTGFFSVTDKGELVRETDVEQNANED